MKVSDANLRLRVAYHDRIEAIQLSLVVSRQDQAGKAGPSGFKQCGFATKQQTAGKLRLIRYAAGAHDSRMIHTTSKGYCAQKRGHELRKSWSCAGQTVPAGDGPTIQMSQLQMRSQVARCFSCSGRLSGTTAATRVQSRAAQLVIPGLRGAAARGQQLASTWDLHCGSVGAKGFWVMRIDIAMKE
jgi:hypothetical protein